jgi:lysozyme family protein
MEAGMADFEVAIEKVLDIETGGDRVNGGYTNDPDDPGGETKWGISKRAHPDVHIASLSERGAKRLYKEHYWNKLLLDQVPDQDIAEELLDTAVNIRGSWVTAGEWLQEALNMLAGAELKVDGFVGQRTLKALTDYLKRNYGKVVLLTALNGIQFEFYRGLWRRNPKWAEKYINGWINKRVRMPRA